MKIEKYETVKRWINGVQADHIGSIYTERSYLRSLKRFVKWTKKNPDQLIKERKQQLKSEDQTVKRKAEETLRSFCLYLEKEKGLKRSSVISYHSALKSFYRYNYVPLQLRTPKKISVHGLTPHTHEEIKKLYNVANLRDRALLLCLAESGMSREDFVELTYGDVKEDYETEKETILLKVKRRKEGLAYHTFFGINATKTLRNYLEARKRKGEKFTKNTPLFKSTKGETTIKPNGLNYLLLRLGKKAGIHSTPHRFRKFFESHMGLTARSILVKYWMGHSLGVESSYFIPSVEDQRKAYMEAYRKIDIFKTEMSEIERRKRQIKDSAKMLGLGKEKLERLEQLLAHSETMEELDTIPEQIQKLEKLEPIRKETEEDCQKIVNEQELPEYLEKHWHVVCTLPSGKIVVSNE